MGARIRELVQRLIDKVRVLVTPPMAPVPVASTHRPRR
jgi:hypothetical protein